MEPGWYQDPGDPSLVRYWDGGAWTAHTQPAASVQPPATAPSRKGLTPSWFMVAAAAVVSALLGVVVTLLVTDGDSMSESERRQQDLDDRVTRAERRADEDRSVAQDNACKVEKKTILTALEATLATEGSYPDTISDMVGTGPTDFLQEDPSDRWSYDGDPDTLTGVGKCDGL